MVDDPLAEIHRAAYNAAFEELGLNWAWDMRTYEELAAPGPHAVLAYLQREQSHLLRAYEADFIVKAIEGTKERCHAAMRANLPGASAHSMALRTNP